MREGARKGISRLVKRLESPAKGGAFFFRMGTNMHCAFEEGSRYTTNLRC
jgi:hypothetical protein